MRKIKNFEKKPLCSVKPEMEKFLEKRNDADVIGVHEIEKSRSGGEQRLAETGLPKISKEEKKMMDRAVKNEIIDAKRIVNKAKTDEELRFKLMRAEHEEKGWFLLEPEKLNKSKQETEMLKDAYKKFGIELTKEDCTMLKKERRLQEKVKCHSQEVLYFRTMPARVGERGMMILLVIFLIVPACPMPRNPRAYHVKVVALALAQTGNISGYFGTPFPGVALMNTNNGLLDTAIKANEKGDGSGSPEAVLAAMAEVKISVDLLIVFIRSMCIANQTDAAAYIAAAGMIPKKERQKNTKPEFGIKQGATGEVVLTSLAAKIDGKRVDAIYYWQYGLMVAGVLTWYDLPETVNQCQTTATGMPTGQTVSFRKATKTKKGGLSAWSVVKTISPV